MNVKPVLWTYRPRKDGSCNIKIYVSFKSVKKFIKTPYHCFPRDFNKTRGKVKRSHPNHFRINPALYEMCMEIETQILKDGHIDRVGDPTRESLIVFLKKYIDDIERGLTPLRKSSAKNYTSLQTRLNQYMKHTNKKDFSFDEVDMDFYNNFKRFLFDFCACGLPGFSKHVKVLKTIMRIAQEAGLHQNEVYKSRLFKRHRKTLSDKIFLTQEEIGMIEKVNLSHDPGLDKERDRFLISYYFLMRYEDSRRIKKNNLIPGNRKDQKMIKYRQEKTGHYCIVPVKSNALRILEKRNFDLSGGSNPQSNREIKMVCALAGVTHEVQQGEQVAPKWKFVTTHTARRSAATNLALQNVSIKIIADLGGWSDIDTLRTYLRASGLDSAQVAQDLDFFL